MLEHRVGYLGAVFLVMGLLACGTASPTPGAATSATPNSVESDGSSLPTTQPTSGAPSAPPEGAAAVIDITASGQPGDYTFSVTVASPDTGCDQYADWWEVISEDGRLIYRRVLLHSHVSEQPFTRSGRPVAISSEETVLVRAHMSESGYGGTAMQGTVAGGFAPRQLPEGYLPELAEEAPLPSNCAF